MKRIILDLDETLCRNVGPTYKESLLKDGMIERIREYKAMGFEIVINTSRNMRTYNGNVGKINANTLPVILEWLDRYQVPYDEIYVGKPWCGHEGFYVDDKSIRPDEFISKNYDEIKRLVGIDQ